MNVYRNYLMEKIDNHVLEELKSYKDERLRDYQQHNKTEIYNKWELTNTVLLQMPTGTGKTRLFVSIINDFQNYGKIHNERINILIITHRKELVDQITGELSNSEYGIKPSFITPADRYSRYHAKPVCVASIQTLNRRLYEWKDYHFDVVVIDEAHHVRGDSYHKVMKLFADSKLLGVTATPYRLNEYGLAHEFDELIVSPPVKDFIEAGWLSNYVYYSISANNELYEGLDNIPLNNYGDYDESGLWKIIGKDKIRANIVGSYLRYAKGKKGIVYTINNAHNNQLCYEFQKCGIRAYGIDHHTDPDVRANIVKRFRTGEIDIICNVNIFTEGFDCPDVEFVQLARPTKSLGLYLQQVGRGLRIAPGKEKVIFLDNVGLYNRFGFPSTKRKWGMHFVGRGATEYGIDYANKIDNSQPFVFSHQNPDLSEGSEEVKLIATTGVNDIVEETKREYVEEYSERLKGIIDRIFETNLRICKEYLDTYSEPHFILSYEYKEDLLNPCPRFLLSAETDDMDYMMEKIEKEFKPVVKAGEIEYEDYKGWDDYCDTKLQMIYSRFMKKVSNKNKHNFQELNPFTISQIRIFFDTYYGSNHNMTIKLNRFNYLKYDPTWKSFKGFRELYNYYVTIKERNSYGYEYERTECRY